MERDITIRLSTLVEKIKAYQAVVDAEANRLRKAEFVAAFDKRSARSWCLSVVGDSLVRVRLLLEQNFNFVETLGVVAVSRYLFELSVWLYLFEQDERYGLVYYGQLIETQHKKHNGYGFQAYLVEKKAAPPVETALKELDVEQADFNVNVLPKIEDLALANGKKKRWEWKKMAESIGLLSEYNYIYTFSSKLLHATPASITTNQKNLEPEEMLVFLKYIEVKLVDMLDLAGRYPRNAT